MHESTRSRLEDLLHAAPESRAHEIHSDLHLAGCSECAKEVTVMSEQADWMRTLRTPSEVEPAPGFYARVLQCIEEHARHSIWYGLVYSRMGRRFAYASLSLALALGLYVVAVEHVEEHQVDTAAVRQLTPEVSGAQTPGEQRDAVLVNFTSFTPVQTVAQ